MKIFHVATTGSDDHAGTFTQPLRTIQRAADLAMPGETVIVHEGLYRERVNPPRGGVSDDHRITYMAAEGELVEIRGSERVTGWKHVADDAWQVTLPNTYFGDFNPYRDVVGGEWCEFGNGGWNRHTGAIYMNGDWLAEVNNLDAVMQSSGATTCWFAEVDLENTTIHAHFPGVDPNEETVEINVRQSIFYPSEPGRNFITVRGFTMRHAATPWSGAMSEQVGLIGTHWSKGWIIENNVISHSMNTGITLGRYGLGRHGIEIPPATAPGFVTSCELAIQHGWSKANIGGHTVRNNHISHCEKNGIHGSLGGVFSTIEGNVIHDIAIRGWIGGPDVAGLKLLGSVDTLIKGNHIYRCRGCGGIWLDWMAQGRVTGNILHDNAVDLFMEVDHGPFLIDHNLFLSLDCLRDWSQGGAYAHNIFAGKLELHADPERMTPFHKAHSTELAGLSRIACGDNRFINNIFSGAACSTSCYDDKQDMRMTGNVYLAGAKPGRHDPDALVVAEAETGFSINEENGEWMLRLPADTAWNAPRKRNIVTSELLGVTKVPGLPYEQPDGSAYRLDVDYSGGHRISGEVAAGPFDIPRFNHNVIKVWPKG